IGREVQIPVALDPQRLTRGGDQQVSGRELVDTLDDALGEWGARDREEVIHRAPVESARDVGELEEGLELGRKEQSAPNLCVVERLDPDPVAGQEELPAALVPEREGEHAPEVIDEIGRASWREGRVGDGGVTSERR